MRGFAPQHLALLLGDFPTFAHNHIVQHSNAGYIAVLVVVVVQLRGTAAGLADAQMSSELFPVGAAGFLDVDGTALADGVEMRVRVQYSFVVFGGNCRGIKVGDRAAIGRLICSQTSRPSAIPTETAATRTTSARRPSAIDSGCQTY